MFVHFDSSLCVCVCVCELVAILEVKNLRGEKCNSRPFSFIRSYFLRQNNLFGRIIWVPPSSPNVAPMQLWATESALLFCPSLFCQPFLTPIFYQRAAFKITQQRMSRNLAPTLRASAHHKDSIWLRHCCFMFLGCRCLGFSKNGRFLAIFASFSLCHKTGRAYRISQVMCIWPNSLQPKHLTA